MAESTIGAFYSLAEVADILKVSKCTVRRWALKEKKMPYYKIGIQLRIKREDLQAFISQSKGGFREK